MRADVVMPIVTGHVLTCSQMHAAPRYRRCAAKTCVGGGAVRRRACSDRVPRRNHLRASSGSPISAASRPTDWYRYGLGFCLVLRMPCRQKDATLAGGHMASEQSPSHTFSMHKIGRELPAWNDTTWVTEIFTVEEALVVWREQISGPDLSW